jgi:hypothetical protein
MRLEPRVERDAKAVMPMPTKTRTRVYGSFVLPEMTAELTMTKRKPVRTISTETTDTAHHSARRR